MTLQAHHSSSLRQIGLRCIRPTPRRRDCRPIVAQDHLRSAVATSLARSDQQTPAYNARIQLIGPVAETSSGGKRW